jgi:hypothetical protein
LKILIIANTKVVFGKELRNELVSLNKDVILLDFESLMLFDKDNNENNSYNIEFLNYRNIPKLSMFFRMFYIKKIIDENDFDIINIHMSRWYYIIILPWLIKQKLVITFYGSDFYGTSNFIKNIQKILYKKADIITFTNPMTQKSFIEYYKEFDKKCFVCRFGLKTLDFIDKNIDKDKVKIKEHLGYSTDKIIITCGYNAIKEQQHEEIIQNIVKLPIDILDKIQFIFPMTYGDKTQKEKVKLLLQNTKLDYVVLEDFLYGDDNAFIKIVSDIMLNLQTMDSFSGTMQEFLYTGNIVITGDWLPYELFDENGIKYLKISNIGELNNIIINIIENKKSILDLEQNKGIIYSLSSWKNNIKNWMSIYE